MSKNIDGQQGILNYDHNGHVISGALTVARNTESAIYNKCSNAKNTDTIYSDYFKETAGGSNI